MKSLYSIFLLSSLISTHSTHAIFGSLFYAAFKKTPSVNELSGINQILSNPNDTIIETMTFSEDNAGLNNNNDSELKNLEEQIKCKKLSRLILLGSLCAGITWLGIKYGKPLLPSFQITDYLNKTTAPWIIAGLGVFSTVMSGIGIMAQDFKLNRLKKDNQSVTRLNNELEENLNAEKARTTKLRCNLENVTQKLDKKQQENFDDEINNLNLNSKILTLEMQNKRYREQLESNEKSSSERFLTIEQLESEKNKLKQEIELLKQQINAQPKNPEDELQQLREKVANQTKRYQELSPQIGKLRNEKATLTHEKDALTQNVNDAEMEIEKLQDQIKRLSQQNNDLNNSILHGYDQVEPDPNSNTNHISESPENKWKTVFDGL